MQKTAVIIVNYNSGNMLSDCLLSLVSVDDLISRIIVFDNASSDNSAQKAQKYYPRVSYIYNPQNIGFSSAINQVARDCKDDYLLVLNPDVFIHSGAIKELVTHMSRVREIGIAAPMLINPDNTRQYSCRRFYDLKTLLFRRITLLGILMPGIEQKLNRRHLMVDISLDNPLDVDWVLGAAFMVNMDVFRKIGMMDEKFFLYFEDVDICKRMNKNGFRVCYIPHAIMTHKHMRKSAKEGLNMFKLIHIKSMFRFILKHGISL